MPVGLWLKQPHIWVAAHMPQQQLVSFWLPELINHTLTGLQLHPVASWAGLGLVRGLGGGGKTALDTLCPSITSNAHPLQEAAQTLIL